MVADADDDVEIAGSAAVEAGIAFPGDTNALSVAGARLHPDLQRFSTFHHTVAMAGRTGILRFAAAAAARAGHIELHTPAGLRNLALAVALRAGYLRAYRAFAAAAAAGIHAGDVEPHH